MVQGEGSSTGLKGKRGKRGERVSNRFIGDYFLKYVKCVHDNVDNRYFVGSFRESEA